MAEENTAAPTGIGRRTILIIAAAGLGSIFLVTGLILGILYFTGALSGNDEIIDRLNAMNSQGETSPKATLLLSSNLKPPTMAPQLKDHGSWMPVWVFGQGRYVYNLQRRKGMWGIRGVGVLTDHDNASA